MSVDWRVLVVDDHPLFRQGVVSTLGKAAGFTVVAEADSCAEALIRLRLTRPDVVLLDVALPDGNGIDLIPEIHAECPDVRVAMLTSADDSDAVLGSLRAGAAGFIIKGSSAAELITALTSICRGDGYTSPTLASRLLHEAAQPGREAVDDLTPRELAVFQLIGQGLTNREIGDTLFLSEKTVKHYVTVVMQKLGVRNRVEAALLARDARKSER